MATEKLIVELEARTAKLDKALDASSDKLDSLSDSSDGADKSLGKLTNVASGVAGGLKIMAGTTAAAATALTALVTITAKSEQELQTLASTANVTSEKMESLSFAFAQVGIDASGAAQLLNDVTEAASEFGNVESGPFQDFADQLGLTAEEAKALANDIKDLSGDEAMLELIERSQEVGLSFADTNQALKSISSDFQFLTPLIEGNAAAMKDLEARYNEANSALALTAGQSEDLQRLAESTSLLTTQLGNAAGLISASVAPQFEAFFNAVIEIVPEATNAIVDFINQFKDASEIQSIDQLNRQIEEQETALKTLNDEYENYEVKSNGYTSTRQTEIADRARMSAEISEETERLKELEAQRDSLQQQEEERLAKVEAGEGGSFSADTGTGQQSVDEKNTSEIAAIEDRFKTEEQLLLEKLNREIEIIGDNNNLKLELEAEYQNALLDLELERVDSEIAANQKAEKQAQDLRDKDLKAQQKADKDKTSATLSYADAAINAGNLIFEDNKAVRAGLVVADTAAGIVRAFADLPYPAALAASAGIAVTGATQLANIASSSKGGGSVSAPSPAPVTPESPQDALQSEDQFIDASDASGANESVIVVRIEGGGDEITEAIANNIKVMQVSGTLS